MSKNALCTLGPALLAALVSGCSQAPVPQGKPGSVKIGLKTNAHAPAGSALTLPAICGDITLAPFSLSASGTATAAGAPIVLSGAGASANTLAIAGCIDSLASSADPSAPVNDWEYLVTATNFRPCDPNDTATLPSGAVISPASVTTAVSIDCRAGFDVSANVVINVSVPVPNSGGYVDISTTVNATEVEVGCKTADKDSHNASLLNFGMSQTADTQAGLSDGILGIGGGAAPAAQYQSQLNGGGHYMQFYTGQLALSAGMTFQQSLVGACGQGAEFHGSNTPTCTTTTGDASITTSASLTTATIVSPTLAAWVNLTAGGALAFTTSSPATHLLTPSPAAGSASAFNSTVAQTFSASAVLPCVAFTGIWASLESAGQFVATCKDSADVPYWTSLSFNGAAWTAGLVMPVSGPGGLTSAQTACLGLYGQAPAGVDTTCFQAPAAACLTQAQLRTGSLRTLYGRYVNPNPDFAQFDSAFSSLGYTQAIFASSLPLRSGDAGNKLRLGGSGELAYSAAGAAFLASVAAYQQVAAAALAAIGPGPVSMPMVLAAIAAAALPPYLPAAAASTYSVGGTILGLTTSGLQLASPAQATLSPAALAGSFTFAAMQGTGTPYAVTVAAQPAGQVCVVSNAAGSVAAANITSIVVACGPVSYAAVTVGLTEKAVGVGGYTNNGPFTIAIASDGTLWGWGSNTQGNLGLGDTVDRLIPTKIGSSTWSRVSAGRGYVLGIQTDGTLWAWGRDDNNQLGDYYAAWGSITYLAAFNNVPVQLSPVMISAAGDWQEVQAGMVATSSAIKGGALWQWGYNTDMFQVGAATNWVTVNSAGGGAFYSAINSLGELWQWTLTTPPPNYTLVASAETQFDAPNHYLSVSAYNGSVLLVRADHTLWAFGLNYAGQLGLGYASSSFLTPVPFQQVGVATDWTAVSIYGPTSFGIRGATNDLYSWGFNNLGLLGDGTLVNKTSPVLVGTGYQSIPQGNTESVALKTDGTIWECGQNTQGEFGRGVLDAALVTTRVQAP